MHWPEHESGSLDHESSTLAIGPFILASTVIIVRWFLNYDTQQVMAKRDELLIHQEVKLRNKLVEYLTDWVLPSAEHHQSIPVELSVLSK